jgi:hypothetical protein
MPPFVHAEEQRHRRVLLVERVMQWVAVLSVVVLFLVGFAR